MQKTLIALKEIVPSVYSIDLAIQQGVKYTLLLHIFNSALNVMLIAKVWVLIRVR